LRYIGLRLDLYHSSNKEEVYKIERMLDNYADFRAYQKNPEKKAQVLVHRLRDLLTVLVDEMKQDKFSCGDSMTIADFCLAAIYFDVRECKTCDLKAVLGEF